MLTGWCFPYLRILLSLKQKDPSFSPQFLGINTLPSPPSLPFFSFLLHPSSIHLLLPPWGLDVCSSLNFITIFSPSLSFLLRLCHILLTPRCLATWTMLTGEFLLIICSFLFVPSTCSFHLYGLSYPRGFASRVVYFSSLFPFFIHLYHSVISCHRLVWFNDFIESWHHVCLLNNSSFI